VIRVDVNIGEEENPNKGNKDL